ncbi:hypothetical protein Pcinc_042105 [Petrolisthes cinctipes]|uniref:Uncharacterized protein n=1 Tax=Petrolisthes cinctipes TaxID=88211 RepID=A0AAE1BIX0_PETCI|nr:hypothetical protein Pcinc_042105 [Petrolisthes cinctipes]
MLESVRGSPPAACQPATSTILPLSFPSPDYTLPACHVKLPLLNLPPPPSFLSASLPQPTTSTFLPLSFPSPTYHLHLPSELPFLNLPLPSSFLSASFLNLPLLPSFLSASFPLPPKTFPPQPASSVPACLLQPTSSRPAISENTSSLLPLSTSPGEI